MDAFENKLQEASLIAYCLSEKSHSFNALHFFFRDRDISRHDSGLGTPSDGSLLSTTSFASSKSCIVYRGGHFAGRERLDFLRFLSEMNMDHVVERIFSFLGAVDLCRVACTSVRWHDSLISDPPSNLKRIDFLIDCKKNRVSCLHGKTL